MGQSIGDLILQRCQLEDAFFISSLLDTPLEQLRARGFPVDRILTPIPPPEDPKPAANDPQINATAALPAPQVAKTPAAVAMESSSSVESGRNGGTQGSNTTSRAPPGQTDPVLSPAEIMQMVQEMFPDADEDFLKREMGPSPSLEQVRQLAERMSTGDYVRKRPPQPKAETTEQHQTESLAANRSSVTSEQASSRDNVADEVSKKGKSNGLKKSLGRAFGGLRRGSQSTSSGITQSGPVSTTSVEAQETGPVPPHHDASNHSSLNHMLENAVATSAPVDANGVKSNDTLLTGVPKELDRGSTCEVVPGQSLKPFAGPRGDGRTHNGIRVFASRNSLDSEPFLQSNEDAIEKFALVIRRLAGVYDVDLKAVAIFHDPCGGTIAFNANRALHFNLRFFHALHYLQNKHESYDCYSYWMVVFAHEIAHHLVSAHGKEHGFYTESYIAKYLPKFLALMNSLPKTF